MKVISPELKAHLSQEVTTLAHCWKISRRDGVVQGFTEHDQNIIFDGVTYLAASGFTPTAVDHSAALNVDNLDVEGMLDSAFLQEADLHAGRYDFAEIEYFMVNYADVSQGRLMLKRGWLGEVTTSGGRFIAEVRGLMQRLDTQVGEHYSPGCRANFTDARCKVNAASVTVSGTVSHADVGRSVFSDTSRSEAGNYFTHGRVRFTSGANAGLSMEVKQYTQEGQFTLMLAMPYPIAVGDGYEALAGCDKTFHTCTQRFDNAINFRGEPHVPGTDRLLETAATRNLRQ